MESDTTNIPQLITTKQLADLMQVSEKTIQRRVAEKMIPEPIQLGRSLRWDSEAIRDWISDGCPPPERTMPLLVGSGLAGSYPSASFRREGAAPSRPDKEDVPTTQADKLSIPKLVDQKRLAEKLALSERTLYRHRNRGLVPSPIRLKSTTRWDSAIIRTWIKSGCPPPGATAQKAS